MKTLIDLFKLFKKRKGEVFIYRTGIRRFTFTYANFYRLCLQMSSYLEKQGVKKGDRVALWAPNSPWWAISYFGILLKGAIAVPIDFISGKERAEAIVKLSGAKLIIQSDYKFEKLNPLLQLADEGLKSVSIESLQFILQEQNPLFLLPKVKGSDIAELVYTSGTTGDPKGVILTHKNISINILQALGHIKIKSRCTFLSLLPLSHMLEQNASFLIPLFRGDKIVYLRTLKPSAILDSLREENISIMVCVPRLLDLLKNTIERELEAKKLLTAFKILAKTAENKSLAFKKTIFYPIHKKFGRNFKFFISGGSALSIETAKFWKRIGFKIVEGYGLTECSPILTANTLESQILGSVGNPVKGVEIKIEDGEILAKGKNIFSGYWQNTRKSKDAFDNKGWFKTGDVGALGENGNLYIKGRKKDIIVTSEGINIYPSDIENVLNYMPEVKESCVVGLNKGKGEEVHAVLILRPGIKNIKKIIQKANEKLDQQAKITSFSSWPDPDFPKTTTLKIQKYKVLEELKKESGSSRDNSSEDPLISLISSLTSESAKEIKDNSILTTDLGFTSIGRLELTNFIEQEFRIDLDDSVINQKTRVKDLRAIIAKGVKNKKSYKLKLWSNKKYAVLTRRILDYIVHFPFIYLFFDLKIKGQENLKNLKTPVIFISNHISYLDQPAIMKVMPKKLRYSTATAVKEEFFFENNLSLFQKIWKVFGFVYATFAFNSFLLPQKSGFRKNLIFMGKLIDNNLNMLIFPEGTRARDGKLQNFMPGLGLIVKELQVPVIPIRILGIENIFPRGAVLPRRGKCEIIFGKPIEFTIETPNEIIEKSKKAILDLAL